MRNAVRYFYMDVNIAVSILSGPGSCNLHAHKRKDDSIITKRVMIYYESLRLTAI